MRSFFIPLLIMECSLLLARPVDAEDLQAGCFIVAPFILENTVKAQGCAVDLAEKIFNSAGLSLKIQILPLSRALDSLDHGNMIIIFLARSPERENKYTWITELYNDSLSFASPSDQGSVNSLQEAKKLGNILVRRNGSPEFLLHTQGFTNIDNGAETEKFNLEKMLAGRGNAWMGSTMALKTLIRSKQAESQITLGKPIQQLHFWMAASPNVAPEIIQKLRKAAQILKDNGEFEKAFSSLQ